MHRKIALALIALALAAAAPRAQAQYTNPVFQRVPVMIDYSTLQFIVSNATLGNVSIDTLAASNSLARLADLLPYAIITNALDAVAFAGEADPVWSAVSNAVTVNAANGATAYGWGNHAGAGYLTATYQSFGIWGIEDDDTIGVLAHRVFREAGWWGINAARELIVTNTGWTDEFWATNEVGHIVMREIP